MGWTQEAHNLPRCHETQVCIKSIQIEKSLVKDLSFLGSTIAGTQQIRLYMGRALFCARVEFDDPLFLTISPRSRHSGMCVRLSRYRQSDPAKTHDASVHRCAGAQQPKIWQQEAKNNMTMDILDYPLRRIMAARDPWAVIHHFIVSIKYGSARLTGLQRCPERPNCNNHKSTQPCSNSFGHNMMPMGGVCGLAVALGGSVEYQGNDDPHFHGNLHVGSIYQHKTLLEIAA